MCERNFPISVAIDLYKGNLFAFRETVKTPADLGAEFLIVGTIDNSGEAVGMSDKILTTEELYNFVLSYIPQYIDDGAPVPLSLAGIFNGINTSEYKITIARHYEDKNCDKRCLCGLIRKSMHIDFNGVEMPCPPMGLNDAGEKYFSTIFDKPLKELLNDGDYMNLIDLRLGDYFKANPLCAACEYKNRCASGCPANAIADSGELLGIDKKTCKFFKEGCYDRVVAIAEKLNLKRLGV